MFKKKTKSSHAQTQIHGQIKICKRGWHCIWYSNQIQIISQSIENNIFLEPRLSMVKWSCSVAILSNAETLIRAKRLNVFWDAGTPPRIPTMVYMHPLQKILILVVSEAILRSHPFPDLACHIQHPPKKNSGLPRHSTYTVVNVDGATPQRWLSKGLW